MQLNKKKFILGLFAISILSNIALLYDKRMTSVFFGHDVNFYNDSLQVSGVFVFNDRNKQSDPKKHVQHFYLKCYRQECLSVESHLMNGYINLETREVEVVELNYLNKSAVVEAFGCRITVNGKTVGFTCKDGDVGAIGSHIHLFYDHYSLF